MYCRNVSPSFGVARLEGCIGEVALIAGAINSNPPLCRFFGYFLGGARKYRPRQGEAEALLGK